MSVSDYDYRALTCHCDTTYTSYLKVTLLTLIFYMRQLANIKQQDILLL